MVFDAFFYASDPSVKNHLENLGRYALKFSLDRAKLCLWRIKFKAEQFLHQGAEEEEV
jgi:hypothetical protein